MLDLCTLGTGGALPLPDRGLSSLYVRLQGRALLIDCGENTQTAIRRIGWGFRHIEGLLLTHYHADHCGGLPGFLLSLAKSGRKEPFHIYGCTGLKHVVDGLRVVAPQLPYPVELHEFHEDLYEFDIIGLQVTAFRLNHSVPCYGYRFVLPRPRAFDPQKARELGVPQNQWGLLQQGDDVVQADGSIIKAQQVLGPERPGLSFVYATDTRPVDIIPVMGENTDMMFLEGMYGNDEKLHQAHTNRHMLFREAADLAKRANTRQLVLTHFSNCIDVPAEYLPEATAIFPNTVAAEDLMTFRIAWPGR
ncbi:MAG: ribonuclease Z [Clostridia bacterium]|nr:ribonuclease Z [Clostridia bacterium]